VSGPDRTLRRTGVANSGAGAPNARQDPDVCRRTAAIALVVRRHAGEWIGRPGRAAVPRFIPAALRPEQLICAHRDSGSATPGGRRLPKPLGLWRVGPLRATMTHFCDALLWQS